MDLSLGNYASNQLRASVSLTRGGKRAGDKIKGENMHNVWWAYASV